MTLFPESSSVSMSESFIVLSELGRAQVFGKICVAMAVGGEMIAYCPYFYVQNGLKLRKYTKQHMLEKEGYATLKKFENANMNPNMGPTDTIRSI
jgi:hypothetical protein